MPIVVLLGGVAALAAAGHAAEQGENAADPAQNGVGPAAPAVAQQRSCDEAIAANRSRWPALLPDTLEKSRNLYLMGLCKIEQGDFREAELQFLRGLDRDLSLAAHWRFRLFHAAMEGGSAGRALSLLRGLLSGEPAAELVDDLRKLLSERMERANGDPREVDYHYLATYFSRLEPTPRDYTLLRHLSRLARHFDDAKLWRKLQVMLWKVPKDKKSALAGALVLAKMGTRRPWRSSADFLTRTRNLAEARLYPLIVKELETPTPPGWSVKAGRELGSLYFRSLLLRKEYRQAGLRVTDPGFVKRFSFSRQDVLRIAIQVNLRRERLALAIKRLRQLEALNPAEENIPDFYLSVARRFEDKKNMGAMITWCRKLLRKFPGRSVAAMAYWLPIWNHYLRGEYEQALNWSDRAIARTLTFSPETRSRYYYWRARILVALGRPEAARDAWQALDKLWPTSYYGMMSRHARQKVPVPPRFTLGDYEFASHSPPVQLKAIWEVAPLRTAMFLFVVGEDERAAAIMGNMLGKPIADGLLEELGDVFRYFGRFRLQYRITANYFHSDLKRYPVAKTAVWRHAYPRAFWPQVLEQTSSQRISPFFVLAVIREESNFHAAADSIAGAKGLMQLMPSTARMVAKRNRLPYEESALTTPELNITLGTLYLKAVLRRYKWNPVLAAASYNAGPNAVKRWQREFGELPVDEFVERIPYDETRAYVKRVMASYLIYRELYHPSPSSG
jgi:soluble lytic murein transglycosylase-like protein